jgi:hypothetical protein
MQDSNIFIYIEHSIVKTHLKKNYFNTALNIWFTHDRSHRYSVPLAAVQYH